MNACRSSNALTTVEKDTFLATPLLEEVRLSHNPGLYWIHPEVLHCTALYCTVLYCTVLYCTVRRPGPWTRRTRMLGGGCGGWT